MQNVSKKFIGNFKVVVLISAIFTSSQGFAWSAISLGGGNWAIICANGTAWSYSGSSAGLDTVGPALCPAGIVEQPSVPGGVRAQKGIQQGTNMDLLRNRKEIADRGVPALRTYPPHGYPCLGCSPCPGNPTEFCDNGNLRIITMPQSRQCRAPGTAEAEGSAALENY